MNALTVCVEYDDLLAITLPRNARHFHRVLVVTTPTDEATLRVCQTVANVEVLQTESFYRDGAPFAKGLAVEEGLDALGREGWLCIWDADTVMPADLRLSMLEFGHLHTPRRRLLWNPADWCEDIDWSSLPPVPDKEHAGYCQFFHADDPVIEGLRPWYGTRWRHAAGCDSDFQAHWPADRRVWLPWEVLHIGQHGTNWCGRLTPRRDGTVPEAATERARRMADLREARKRTGNYHGEWF